MSVSFGGFPQTPMKPQFRQVVGPCIRFPAIEGFSLYAQKNLHLRLSYKNHDTNGVNAMLFFNGDETRANYRTMRWNSDNANASVFTDMVSYPYVGGLPATVTASCWGRIDIGIDCTGRARWTQKVCFVDPAGAYFETYGHSGYYYPIVDITKMQLVYDSGGAARFGAGSYCALTQA